MLQFKVRSGVEDEKYTSTASCPDKIANANEGVCCICQSSFETAPERGCLRMGVKISPHTGVSKSRNKELLLCLQTSLFVYPLIRFHCCARHVYLVAHTHTNTMRGCVCVCVCVCARACAAGSQVG
eukprot:4859137-Amphidinium_carterae.1